MSDAVGETDVPGETYGAGGLGTKNRIRAAAEAAVNAAASKIEEAVEEVREDLVAAIEGEPEPEAVEPPAEVEETPQAVLEQAADDEKDAQARYEAALAAGLSDAEARAEGWPEAVVEKTDEPEIETGKAVLEVGSPNGAPANGTEPSSTSDEPQPDATPSENVEEGTRDGDVVIGPADVGDLTEVFPGVDEPVEAQEAPEAVEDEEAPVETPADEAASQTEQGSTEGTGTTGDGSETATS